MTAHILKVFTLLFFVHFSLNGQNITVENYVFEDGNRGFLNMVQVSVKEKGSDQIIEQVYTDVNGFYSVELDASKSYVFSHIKEIFQPIDVEFNGKDYAGKTKAFLKVKMKRKPGYQFEITLAPKRENEDIPVDAIKGALIEVYNNTTEKEVLVLKDHPAPDFKVNLIKGNHYTVLVRKEGFLAKRMEAFVDVDGCILCFEGIGSITPGVSDNLTEGNEMGVLLANVEMEPLFRGKKMQVQNLYYDFGKATLREESKEELDKVITMFKDNPSLNIELGSHTDARGGSAANQKLSEARAQSAVRYLNKNGGINRSRLIAKGYGETEIINVCKDGVDCTEEEHQQNRRTELKIVGFLTTLPLEKSLYQMKQDEKLDQLILGLADGEQLKLGEGQSLDDVLTEEERNAKKLLLDEAKSNADEKANKVINDLKDKTSNNKTDLQKVEKAIEIDNQTTTKAMSDVKPVSVDSKTIKEEQEGKNIKDKNLSAEDEAMAFIKSSTEALKKEDAYEEPVFEDMDVVENTEIDTSKNKDANWNPYSYIDGPKIVIKESSEFLAPDNEIFKKHQQVFQFQNGDKILYMIGQFDNEEMASDFLNQVVKKNYTDAYILIFDKGNIIQD